MIMCVGGARTSARAESTQAHGNQNADDRFDDLDRSKETRGPVSDRRSARNRDRDVAGSQLRKEGAAGVLRDAIG